jgi:hypothetical protein
MFRTGHLLTPSPTNAKVRLHPTSLLLDTGSKAGLGHEDQFLPLSLSAGYGFRKETIAGTHGSEQDAPLPDLPGLIPERGVR